ncbi:MAG TPA: hypothetical protein VF755_06580 [Catenuloplanes sp.]|jgi:hypothetical protein
MTTTTAALVLAWIAIVLLTLATAGLLRRVEQLSSRGALQAEPGEPVRGLQLPMSTYLGDLAGGPAEVLLLFVSPSCATCQTAIDSIVAAGPGGDYRIAVVTRDAAFEPLSVPDGWTRLTSALGLFQILRVPATPYLVRLGPDGTIIDTTMMVGTLSLQHWLTRQTPAASPA